jgi:hypothetical protein
MAPFRTRCRTAVQPGLADEFRSAAHPAARTATTRVETEVAEVEGTEGAESYESKRSATSRQPISNTLIDVLNSLSKPMNFASSFPQHSVGLAHRSGKFGLKINWIRGIASGYFDGDTYNFSLIAGILCPAF